MKKTIIRTVAILIIATVIAAPGTSAANTIAPTATETLNPLEMFPMTLTPEELLALLKDLEMEIIRPDDPTMYYEIDEDGRMHDGYGNYFWYKCEGILFWFFADNEKMAYISVISDKFATPEGIRVGASRWTVNKKYGICSKLVGGILDFFGIFTGKAGYDAKTKDGYYRFYYDGENKKCDPLDYWMFYVDRTKRYS